MNGKYTGRKKRCKSMGRKRPSFRLMITIFVAASVLSLLAVGNTLAYIIDDSGQVANEFQLAQVSCYVNEEPFDGIVKKNVSVENTGEAPAYIRVKLLPYWYDKENDSIVAKSAWTPEFTMGTDWAAGADGFYYYVKPVNPGESTTVLIPELTLKQDEISLSRQVLEIIASCVQANPDSVVTETWSGSNGSVTGVSNKTLTVTTAA